MITVTTTILYTRNDLEGHRTRLLVAEKGNQIINRIVCECPPEITFVNPTGQLPVLVDKGFILHGSQLIDTFIDERHPTPALLPLSPVPRAKVRFLAEQIRSWYPLAEQATADSIRNLHRQLDEFANSLDHRNHYFLGQLYSLIDIAVAPLLNLANQFAYPIENHKVLLAYFNRLRSRPAWVLSDPPDAIRTRLDASFHSYAVH